MDEPTFNEQMLARLQALLLANAGAQTVTVDGQTVAYADLERRLAVFEGRVAREKGTQRRVTSVYLGGY